MKEEDLTKIQIYFGKMLKDSEVDEYTFSGNVRGFKFCCGLDEVSAWIWGLFYKGAKEIAKSKQRVTSGKRGLIGVPILYDNYTAEQILQIFWGYYRTTYTGNVAAMATTIPEQEDAIKALQVLGFVKVYEFVNPNTDNTVTVWICDVPND